MSFFRIWKSGIYLWPFAVGFIHFYQIVFEWEHFEKGFQNFVFGAGQKNVIFLKKSKTTQLWQSAVTKPLDLQQTKRYLWKDKVHIFHLAHWDFKFTHPLGHSGLMKIMAHFGRWQNMSDTSISFSLSLDGVIIALGVSAALQQTIFIVSGSPCNLILGEVTQMLCWGHNSPGG